MRRFLLIMLVAVLAGALIFGGCAKPAPAPAPEPIEWTLQTIWGRADIYVESLPALTDYVWEKSNGQLKIECFAEPEIVPRGEVFSSTQKGVLDMAHGTGWSTNVPVHEWSYGLPGMYVFPELTTHGARSDEVRDFFYESGLVDLMRQEYAEHGIYWLDMFTGSERVIMCNKEVHTMEDIKGLKLAMWGPGWQQVWLKETGWGSVPIVSPSESYLACKMGTIDSIAFDTTAMTHMNYHEVAPYWVTNIRWADTGACELLVNLDSWNALSDDLKEIVAGGAEAYYQANVERYKTNYANCAKLVEDGEVILSPMDEAYAQHAIEAAHDVWDRAVAEADPASAEAIEIWKQWRGIE